MYILALVYTSPEFFFPQGKKNNSGLYWRSTPPPHTHIFCVMLNLYIPAITKPFGAKCMVGRKGIIIQLLFFGACLNFATLLAISMCHMALHTGVNYSTLRLQLVHLCVCVCLSSFIYRIDLAIAANYLHRLHVQSRGPCRLLKI